jgi:hypothetical protein
MASSNNSRNGLMIALTILVLGAFLLWGIVVSSLALMS